MKKCTACWKVAIEGDFCEEHVREVPRKCFIGGCTKKAVDRVYYCDDHLCKYEHKMVGGGSTRCTMAKVPGVNFCYTHSPRSSPPTGQSYQPRQYKCEYTDCKKTSPNKFCPDHFLRVPTTAIAEKFNRMTTPIQIKVIDAFKKYGLSTTVFTKQDISKKYHKIALEEHPDKGGNEEKFKLYLDYKDLLLSLLS